MSPYVKWQHKWGLDIDAAKMWHRQGKADAEWYGFAAKYADHMDVKALTSGKYSYLFRRQAMEWRAMFI